MGCGMGCRQRNASTYVRALCARCCCLRMTSPKPVPSCPSGSHGSGLGSAPSSAGESPSSCSTQHGATVIRILAEPVLFQQPATSNHRSTRAQPAQPALSSPPSARRLRSVAQALPPASHYASPITHQFTTASSTTFHLYQLVAEIECAWRSVHSGQRHWLLLLLLLLTVW